MAESTRSVAGLRCADCACAEFVFDKELGKYQGMCSRGYTLADPHVHGDTDRLFAPDPRMLVPVVDPYGREYLRTKNVCERFVSRK